MRKGELLILSIMAVLIIVLLKVYYDRDYSQLSNSKGSSNLDKFGIKELYQTFSNGREWYSKWDNVRIWNDSANDYYDPEFITKYKGNGSWNIDGLGNLLISGDTPRMYVIDPLQIKNWHNVEITIYGQRMSDNNIPWGGIMAYARTNHMIDTNYCDTRGYGGRFKYDGNIDFEKEVKHDSEYSHVASRNYWPEGMPKNMWIGYKFIVYDTVKSNVKLELWIDITDGLNGGNWTKINEFTDNGSNFGIANKPCKIGIDSALRLTSSDVRNGSETGNPNLAIYFRSDGVGIDGLWYKKASIREIATN